MDQNNFYKQILEKGTEKASPAFTEIVMTKILAAGNKPFEYKPLLPLAARRFFVFLFLSLVASIIIICLLIITDNIEFSQFLKIPDISVQTFNKATTAILLFWILFAANYWLTKAKKIKPHNYFV